MEEDFFHVRPVLSGGQAVERPLARIRQLPSFLEHGVDVEFALQPFELRRGAATSPHLSDAQPDYRERPRRDRTSHAESWGGISLITAARLSRPVSERFPPARPSSDSDG
jgi:hypothetical protein